MYQIIGVYRPAGFQEEIMDEADSRTEAVQLLKEYKFRCGESWRLFIRKK